MTRRLRVLLVSPAPPPAGGVATWTQRLLAAPITDRFDLRLVNTNPGGESGVSARKIGRYLRWPARLLAELVRFRPDVVHLNSASRMPHLALEARLLAACQLAGARTVLHFRGTSVRKIRQTRWGRRTLARAVSHADGVFALNQGEVAELRAAGASQARQVDNFVMPRPWREPPPDDGLVRVLFVGWIMREKGVFELIEAVARCPSVSLDLVGRFMDLAGGSSEAEVRAACERHGVADRVRFVGELPLARIFEAYDAAQVFVLPSWTEGFPNVLLEAMISGLPCVCTPVGAIPEVLRDGEDGLLVPLRDPEALAAALSRLAADPALRRAMGRAAWSHATTRYGRDAVLGQIGDAWASIASARGA